MPRGFSQSDSEAKNPPPPKIIHPVGHPAAAAPVPVSATVDTDPASDCCGSPAEPATTMEELTAQIGTLPPFQTPASRKDLATAAAQAASAGLLPIQKQMLENLAQRTLADGPVPAVCFMPGTPKETMQAFYSAQPKVGPEFFRLGTRWGNTATNGSGLQQGDPITLTWSFIPDGTSIGGFAGEPASPSNLRAFLNGIYGSQATWQPLFQQVFDRWSQVTGIRYVFQASDDGAAFPDAAGALNVRGDVRIGGHFIDGNSGILAYNFFPNTGDMVIDTGDSNFYGNTASSSLRLRNVVSHEHGHGIGLSHACPTNSTKLMEPFINLNFDGPQLDDIHGANRGYGDRAENNNSSGAATPLVGTALGNGTFTFATLSIDDNSDVDFYRFTTTTANKRATITVTPTGATYPEGPQNSDGSCTAGTSFNSLNIHDLGVQLIDTNGTTVIATANANGVGQSESLLSVPLPSTGPYFIRIFGGTVDNAQLYSFSVVLEDGTAAAPEIAVEQPVGTNLVDGLSTRDFGSIAVGASSALSFTVRNTGTANLTGLAINKDGANAADFIVGALGSTTLAPNTSTTFSVTFSPSTSGTRAAAIRIASNDADENPFDINLTGAGATGTPVVSTTGGSVSYLENSAPVAIDPGITVTDPDSSNFVNATVSISGNFASGQDILNFVSQGGITGSYNSGTGVLSLNGTASVASYQAALRSVSYVNSSDNPSGLIRTISFTVNDGTSTGSATRNLIVTPVNDQPTIAPIPNPAPIAVNASLQTVNLSGIAAGGGESQTLAIIAVSSNTALIPNPTVNYASPNQTGSLSYRPVTGEFGTATITVTLTDNGGTANGGVNTATRTFIVEVLSANGNFPPSFTRGPDISAPFDGGTFTQENWATNISPGSPAESDQNVTFLVSAENPALFTRGPSISSSGTLVFTPSPRASGSTTVTVRAMDDGGTQNGGSDTSAPQTFQISVTSIAEETGRYTALLFPATTDQDNAQCGLLTLQVARSGRFTGRITLGGRRYLLRGQFQNDGTLRHGGGDPTVTLALSHEAARNLTITLTLDASRGTDTVTGFIFSDEEPFSRILGDRALFTSRRNPRPPFMNVPQDLRGNYTAIFGALPPGGPNPPADAFPQGDGFGRLSVSKKGVAKFTGVLADGRRLSAAAPLSKDGFFPIYRAFGRTGSVNGFAQFRNRPNSDAEGRITWFRAPSRRASRYPDGWPLGIGLDFAASKFSRARNASALPGLPAFDGDGNAELAFTDAGIAPPGIFVALGITPGNKVKVLANAPGNLKVKLNGKTGLFGGGLKFQGSRRAIKFGGAVLQKQGDGFGFFLAPTEVGAVTLTPEETPGTP